MKNKNNQKFLLKTPSDLLLDLMQNVGLIAPMEETRVSDGTSSMTLSEMMGIVDFTDEEKAQIEELKPKQLANEQLRAIAIYMIGENCQPFIEEVEGMKFVHVTKPDGTNKVIFGMILQAEFIKFLNDLQDEEDQEGFDTEQSERIDDQPLN